MTDDIVTAKLAEWEALAERATEGPWTVHVSAPTGDRFIETTPPGVVVAMIRGQWGHPTSPADAEFIAAARTAMPALLGFVREVLAECDRLGARNYVGESGSPSDYMSAGERVVIDRVRNLAQKWLGRDVRP